MKSELGWFFLLPILRAVYALVGATLLWLAFSDIAWWRFAIGAVGLSLIIAGGVRSGLDTADVTRWHTAVRDGVKAANE